MTFPDTPDKLDSQEHEQKAETYLIQKCSFCRIVQGKTNGNGASGQTHVCCIECLDFQLNVHLRENHEDPHQIIENIEAEITRLEELPTSDTDEEIKERDTWISNLRKRYYQIKFEFCLD